MTALGIALLVGGAALVVAEAHIPGGVLGVAGAVALVAGVVVLVPALGGSALVAVPVALALALAGAAWALLAVRPAARAQRQRVRAGTEALCGHRGVVRTWASPAGHVYVDGALWRARDDCGLGDAPLHEGDVVVVEAVRGLTLSVRRADDWELSA
jgi:membrane-bound serine protease (ClpP class)